MGLETFFGLTKPQEDLLRKTYAHNTPAVVTLASKLPNGDVIQSRAFHTSDGTAGAKLSLQATRDKLTFTPSRKSDGTSAYSLEYVYSEEIRVKSECRVLRTLVEKTYESTISAEYIQPKYRLKVTLLKPNLGLECSATAGSEKVGVATDVKVDVGLKRVVGYSVAGYWVDKGCRVVGKHVGSDRNKVALGDSVLSYLQRTTERSVVGACVRYCHPKSETFIEFGGVYSLTPATELRAKLDSNGYLSSSASHSFNSNVKATLSSLLDIKKILQSGVSEVKLGIRLDLNSS